MNTSTRPWLADFERVVSLGLWAWIAYAITRTALELAAFGGRIAIVATTAYLTVEYIRPIIHL